MQFVGRYPDTPITHGYQDLITSTMCRDVHRLLTDRILDRVPHNVLHRALQPAGIDRDDQVVGDVYFDRYAARLGGPDQINRRVDELTEINGVRVQCKTPLAQMSKIGDLFD